MRAIVKNLSEMTDSREMLEARTNPAITIFITILSLLILVALIWSFIGEMDTTAKASAVVRPNEKVSNIQAFAAGQVEEVNIVEGMYVEEGKTLIVIKHDEYTTELNNRKAELEQLEQEIHQFNTYKKSVEEDINLFDSTNPDDDFFYNLTEQYRLEYEQLKLEFEREKRQLSSTKAELTQAEQSIELNIRSTKTTTNETKISLERQIKDLTEKLTGEKSLQQSIKTGVNSIPATDSLRTAQYNKYVLQLQQLEASYELSKQTYERSQQLGERLVSKSQLENELANMNAAKLQLEQFQEETMIAIDANVEQMEDKLADLNQQLSLLNNKNGSAAIELENLYVQNEQLSTKRSDLTRQEEISLQVKENALEKFKIDRIVQIQSTIEDRKEKIDRMNETIKQLELEIERRILKAPVAGRVNIVREVNNGDIVQGGESLLTILPQDETLYKASIAVANHEIGQIEIGDTIELNMHAFPKQSFGSIKGEVVSIGSDAVVQQDGMRYYLVEASLSNTPLKNRKGEEAEIRVGMTADAYVITDSQKVIHFLLEKINLKE